MKRFGNLYESIISWDNLYQAAKNAQKAKRYKQPVLEFNFNLENNLLRLKEELETQIYTPGNYKTFDIYDTKHRMISAAPYRDRVVHHALCQVITPIFERTYIANSFAYRKGKGTHQAVELCKQYARRYRYVLKSDIRKYFPSIDHEILKELLAGKIKCKKTLWLIETIIDGSNPQGDIVQYFPGDDLFEPVSRRRGLPIGNLTSQHFANIFLNPLDHYVTETLRCSSYIRYVDDFILFSNSKEQVAEWKKAIERFLEKYRLRIHPVKSQIHTTKKGVSFLGYRVFPNKVRVSNANVRRAGKRFRTLQQSYKQGEITLNDVKQQIVSWIAHVSHANSWKLREKVIGPLVFQ